MSRADVRTFAWLLPVALVLVFWWGFKVNPCLDNEIAKSWRARYPPAAESATTPAVGPDAVIVENPYGISTCDYWPSGLDIAINFAILAGIALLIGFLSARSFQRRAGMYAAAIVSVALCLSLAFGLFVYLPDYDEYLRMPGYGPLLHAASYLLTLSAGAGALAWLAAILTTRWLPRG